MNENIKREAGANDFSCEPPADEKKACVSEAPRLHATDKRARAAASPDTFNEPRREKLQEDHEEEASKNPALSKLYVLGHPVAHSKSPVMHNAMYARLGLGWSYSLADCETAEQARAFISGKAFRAINITTPYKDLAFSLADVRAASAKLAEGANMLVNKEGKLIAYNTDGIGCVSFLEREGFNFAGKKVAVCGTGPTSLAILHACTMAGAQEALLLSRDRDRCEKKIRAYLNRYKALAHSAIDLGSARTHHRSFAEGFRDTLFRFGSYEVAAFALQEMDLIVDATPLGMNEQDPAPFDTRVLHEGQWVVDVTYVQQQSTLLKAAKAAGVQAFNGAGMLVAQAVESFNIVCDLCAFSHGLSYNEVFEAMASAAGFTELCDKDNADVCEGV